MTSKPIILEIASTLVHEADPEELEEIERMVDEERKERRKIGI